MTNLGLLGLGGVVYSAYKLWPDAGVYQPCLSAIPKHVSNHPLMKKIWSEIDPTEYWDSHVHVVGTGDGESGIWFNPNMDSWAHPILKIQKYFYENGACATDTTIDFSTMQRLIDLSASMPAGCKSLLFAFDWFHDENGKPNRKNTIFYIPNAYAKKLASENSHHFEWVASIHPYRADAVDALTQAKAEGARAIKWLPPSMGIDPASPKCDAFYRKAADLNIPIIAHTGHENAVQGGNQNYGNPLRLRRALDQGVRVIMAHCASDGTDDDLDHGNKRINSLDLFARLMDTTDYQSLVFGEISALTLVNHAWAIKPILERTDWHSRLINGSDYPLPAIMPLINTRQLNQMGLLKSEYLPFLQELKQFHPLMYDFAVKRLIEFNGINFDNKVFATRRFFENAT
ncbi:MAG TPA: amidohydrolase family protein [Methylophilaceae bacterium]|nr:amidohydrolase family protein [Methylophilaceae bacterium]